MTKTHAIWGTLLDRFIALAARLSPENLHADGEISASQAAAKRKRIMEDWRKLEAELGRSVSEEEVWSACQSRQQIATNFAAKLPELGDGFILAYTGGNCTALVKTLPNGKQIVVTDEGGMSAYVEDGDIVLVGCYDSAEWSEENGVVTEVESLAAAKKLISQLEGGQQ